MRKNDVLASKKLFMVACLVACLVMAGCAKDDPPIDTGWSDAAANSGSGVESTSGEGLPTIDENTLFGPSGLQSVYFDYNSYSLRPDALEVLRQNAEMIRQLPGVAIQIEGHCDERGTQEYNLALGEKRALATRQHLMNLGVSGDRIITISYGEEDPAAFGHDESSWSRNRRCEFNKAL